MGKFKINDIVICIDNTLLNTFLTIGKSYIVSNIMGVGIVGSEAIRIIDDSNVQDWFSDSRFIHIIEYRNNIISNILK